MHLSGLLALLLVDFLTMLNVLANSELLENVAIGNSKVMQKINGCNLMNI